MRSTKRTWWSAAAGCAVIVASVVLLAPPAFGKGIESASIDGPGLAEPVKLSTEPSDPNGVEGIALFDDAGREVGLVDELNPWVAVGDRTPQVLPDAPTLDLGPAYVVSWRFNGMTTPVEQDLYPFAAGGPLVHFSAYETRGYGTSDVWYRAPDSVLTTLADIGVIAGDRSGPLSQEQPVTAASASPGSSSGRSWPAVVVGSIAAAGLAGLGGVVAVRRSGSRRRMAPTSP